MDWRESVSEGFPRRNRDEPPSLRRDIADELADHLANAFARELERTGDEAAARRAVLDRFGDPKKLARRLWLDAMREVIMNQRILLATCIVLAAACLAIATFSWIAMNESRETNRALLTELKDLADQAETNSPWAHLSVRVLRGSDDEPPVEGVAVTLKGNPYDEKEQELKGQTGGDGRCRFGPVQPGTYRIQLDGAGQQAFGYNHGSRCLLVPGRQEQVFHYPDTPQAQFRLQVELPPDIQSEHLVFQGWVYGVSTGGGWVIDPQSLFFNRQGVLYDLVRSSELGPVMNLPQPRQRLISAPAVRMRLELLYVFRPMQRKDGSWLGLPIITGDETQSGEIAEINLDPGMENVWTLSLKDDALAKMRAYLSGPDALNPNTLIASLPVQQISINQQSETTWSINPRCPAALLWPEIPADEAGRGDRRFVLALCAKTAWAENQPIDLQVYEILEPWDPTSSPPVPLYSLSTAEEPAVVENLRAHPGWKGIDVTSLVRDQAASGRLQYGIMIRLANVSCEFYGASAGDFRPVLLIKKAEP